MGSNFTSSQSINQLEDLCLTYEQKQTLKIYLWRASPQNNKYISRVQINCVQENPNKGQNFQCLKTTGSLVPSLQFEKYVCDFRTIQHRLNLAQLLCVFRSLLKGHEQIFKKLGVTLINQKCSFINHEGQIRIWINPNYYLNQIWKKTNKQIKLKSFSCHSSHGQTPRFMNKQQFDFQNINPSYSQAAIVKRIIQFMHYLTQNCSLSNIFLHQLEKYIQKNILKNSSFESIHKFINQFSYAHKISFQSNIKSCIELLIKSGLIFSNNNRQKKSLSMNTVEKNISCKKLRQFENKLSLSRKEQTNIEQTFFHDTEMNMVSVLDIKKSLSGKKYDLHSNLSRLLATTTYQQGQIDKQNQKEHQLYQQKDQFSWLGNSLKEKRFGHRRKLSKSLVEQIVPDNSIIINSKQKQTPTVRSQAFRKPLLSNENKSSIKRQQTSIFGQNTNKNLNLSYQFSINLYTGPQKVDSKSTELSNPLSLNQKLLKSTAAFSGSRQKTDEQLRISKHSKTASILKNGNICRSFVIKDQLKNLQDSDLKQNNQSKLQKKKTKHVVLKNRQSQQEPKCRNRNSIGPYKASDDKNRIQLKKYKNQAKCNNLFTNFKQQKKQNEYIFTPNKLSCPLDYPRKRQASCFNLQNISINDQSKLFQQDKICQQTTYNKKSSRVPTLTQIVFSDTSLTNNVNRYKINAPKQYIKPQQVLNSVLINGVSINQQMNQQIIKSKRRISWGQTDQLNNDVNNLKVCTNHSGLKTFRTITRLVSSNNNLQTSVGSFTDDSFSACGSNNSKYSGILTKMGRSIQFDNNISKHQDSKVQQLKKKNSIAPNQQMPNFHKKKSIYQHGLNRSMKL